MMKKHFLQIVFGSFFISLVLLLASCTGNESTPEPAKSDSADESLEVKGIAKEEKLLSGYLDTLWIQAPIFVALNPKLTFRFYDTLNSFTLHGWLGNNNSYNNRPPDVRLKKGRQSTVQFGSGSYFGNLLLSASSLNIIQRDIATNNATYVLFAPQDPGANNGQVSYRIFLTRDDPGLLTLTTAKIIPTTVFTNPSPPRNE